MESLRSSPGGLDQTEPQMLYLAYPQPYGSGLSVDVSVGFEIRKQKSGTPKYAVPLIFRISFSTRMWRNAGEVIQMYLRGRQFHHQRQELRMDGPLEIPPILHVPEAR